MTAKKINSQNSSFWTSAFTIVELLVVIVIIGILATITFIAYKGLGNKAITAMVRSDLGNNATQLKLYYAEYDSYPTSLDANNCPSAPTVTTKYCFKVSSGNSIDYVGASTSFVLTVTNTSTGISYSISEAGAITRVQPPFMLAWGGTDADYISSIVTTDGDGIIAVGQTANDTVILKYSSDGSLQWGKTLDTTSVDYANAVAKTNDGGFVAVGTTNLNQGGVYHILVLKYDSDGTLQWNKTWSTLNTGYSDYAYAVTSTSDGGFVVAGNTSGYGMGNGDVLLLKYNSYGNLQWSKTWGGYLGDGSGAITATADGGFVVAGGCNNSTDNTSDVLLQKYDSAGNLLWSKAWGGVGHESAGAITATADGGFVVAGSTNSFGAGNGDVLLQKYDSTGNLQWSKTWGGSGSDSARAVAVSTDGGFVITGYTASFGGGSYDAVLLKYASDGTLSWSKTLGGTSNDNALTVAGTSDGGYVMAGITSSFGIGNGDALLVKYNASGTIPGCASPVCQSPSGTVTAPSGTVTTPPGTLMSQSYVTQTTLSGTETDLLWTATKVY